MARPPFEPTPEQRKLVESMSGVGCTVDEILHCIPWKTDGNSIDTKTLAKHFGSELERGRALAGMRLKKTAYELALQGDKTMLIFILKCKHGWSETLKVESSGPNGEPLPVAQLYLPVKDNADGSPTVIAMPSTRRAPEPQPPRQAIEPPPLQTMLPEPEPSRYAGSIRPLSQFIDAADPRRKF